LYFSFCSKIVVILEVGRDKNIRSQLNCSFQQKTSGAPAKGNFMNVFPNFGRVFNRPTIENSLKLLQQRLSWFRSVEHAYHS
jgi:hypothetical protein